MSDDLAPETPDTPENVDTEIQAPVEDTPAPVVDYESRYNNLRSEFDRKSQRLAELEQAYQSQEDPDEYEDEDSYYDDPTAEYAQRIERLETYLTQREQETLQREQVEQETAYINDEIARLEKEQSEEFSDDEWETLGYLSERYRDEDGRPDTERAFEQLFGKIVKARREKYVSTKKAPKVNSGPAAAEIPDLDNSTKRAEYMAQRMADLDEDAF